MDLITPLTDGAFKSTALTPFDCDPSPGLRELARQVGGNVRAQWGEALTGPRGGKMFGVLVVRGDQGQLGYLKAFAGRLQTQWTVPGFVPPLFVERETDPLWLGRERELAGLELTIAALDYSSPSGPEAEVAKDRRRTLSREMIHQVQQVYLVGNWAGDRKTVAEIFAPTRPPVGVGECAAPKLLGQALRSGALPLELAEFWIGTAPASGDREDGVFYPACQAKCGLLLPYMLAGL